MLSAVAITGDSIGSIAIDLSLWMLEALESGDCATIEFALASLYPVVLHMGH